MEKEESLRKFERYLERRFPGRPTTKDYLSDIRQFKQVGRATIGGG